MSPVPRGGRDGSRYDGRGRRVSADSTSRTKPPRNRAEPRGGFRNPQRLATSPEDFRKRAKLLQILGAIVVALLIGRLGWVQLVAGPEFSARAADQRAATIMDPATRGAINDRDGNALAFTMEARALTVHPNQIRSDMEERHRLWPETYGEPDERLTELAEALPEMIGVRDLDEVARSASSRRREHQEEEEVEDSVPRPADISSSEILEKLQDESSSYEVLVRNVDPDKASEVVQTFPELVAERQNIRQYPNGAVAANVVGKIGMDDVGQFGFEASRDATLQGVNGSRTVDLASNGVAIPGSTRDVVDPEDGVSYDLTLDIDMQYYVQQQVDQAAQNSGANSASAVVMDSHTGEVMAMAQSATANPNRDIGNEIEEGRNLANDPVSRAFEPGSVAKIITAMAAIEDGLTTPDEVMTVPGQIDMAGVTVRDAWEHGDEQYTSTGIFGKSSNVGTLMLAERVGQDRFAELLNLLGLGRATGIELPGESGGIVPSRETWDYGTFANLPIGQGMAMSLIQMASIYQTVANDGVRVPPSIVSSETTADGTVIENELPESVRVVSPETARTVTEMFQGVVQSDPTGVQSGTGSEGAIEGYQVSGKTGTAQKIDPDTGRYSDSAYYITFAGIAPADNPRFVVAIMLDEPERGVHGEGGQSAAPLFHDIASWALNRYNVPPSPPSEGMLLLDAG
ncbi:peptidoglycan D,D-transpeptidase FtsI family protein [Corynebacterium sputi]|uniref:peptidoglycan D,D-transpeptidase FtsI family protein n=1 Tax=Corynebacterium sputi TaxID=489915 RepID=UPI00040BEDD0|nr:penicillin-binding protein 2 [Corynebacterium sputi]